MDRALMMRILTRIASCPKSSRRSAWTAKANERVQFGYALNYLIDINHAVIVDVQGTPARAADEVPAAKTLLERDAVYALEDQPPFRAHAPAGRFGSA
jgi:hypothetical protein